jgi:FixJ family two-component response regulator
MPGMTGRELADRMLFEQPHLRVLFISGYTTNVALRRQVVDDEVAFLQKPFAPEELARKVREVLDGRARAGSRV